MTNRLIAALGAVVLAAAPLTAQDAAPAAPKPFTADEEARYLKLGHQAVSYFFDGKADSLLAMMDSASQAQAGGVDGIRQRMDVVAERGGVPMTVKAEKMTRRNGMPQFWYEAEMSNYTQEPIVLRWIFNEKDQLVGMGFGPKSGAPYDGKP